VNILDEGVREALAIEIDTSLPAQRVVRVLQQLETWRGLPKAIRLDNGPELTSQYLADWCKSKDIELRFIQPGKPNQNAFIERFNRSYRTEVLMAGYSRRLRKYEKSRINGFKAITKNDPITHWEACPRLCSVSDCSQGKILLLICLLDGEAYATKSLSMSGLIVELFP
jgi:transposase InsO family protein